MSQRGDSTRDWLLKKLLKAKESLIEQSREISSLGSRLAKANSLAQDLEQTNIQLAGVTERLAEKVDDLEFDIQQLKRVPPIAPNLTVMYRDRRGLSEQLRVTSVEHAAGRTLIRTERS
jgi:DNA repair ATPase RecN